MPGLPTYQAITAMILVAVALFLFTRERIPLPSSALALLLTVTLAVTFLPPVPGYPALTPADLYAGFGNQALVAIVCLMICAKGLERSGTLNPLARLLGHAWNWSPRIALGLTLVTAALCSMFMNNTPIVAMLLPLLVSVSLRNKLSTSGILMPMGYATILGGMTTTIGTSTNLLVVGIAQDLGLPAFGLFDFFLPASVGMVAALVFLWLIAPRLVPERKPPMPQTSPRMFDAVLHMRGESEFVGRSLAEALASADPPPKFNRIERGDDLVLARLPTLELREGDRLYLRETPERLKALEHALGARLQITEPGHQDTDETLSPNEQLAEVVITSSSLLNGRSLGDIHLQQQHELLLIALHRPGQSAALPPEDAVLQAGDVLLVQGTLEKIQQWKRSGDILVLDGTLDVPPSRYALFAALIMGGVVGLAATGLVPIASSALLGVVAMLLTGCINRQSMKAAMDFSIIMVIAASLALGKLLVVTGAAQYMAELFVHASTPMPEAWKVAMLMLAMALLTEVVTNNAAAAIGTPIAISIATTLGAPVEPFVLAVLLGGNMSYMTPMGYQTNLLVMSAGGYRFSDFMRVGIPLQLVVWVSLSLSLAWFYDLAW